MHYPLYIATVIGAIGITLMMPRKNSSQWIYAIGAIIAASTLSGLFVALYPKLPQFLGLPQGALPYYYIFSVIAIAAAARVITHTKPVYAALWFILLILATSGLFLTLDAQFMAMAMVIIYGGAILVTYMFVIMLAARSDDPANESQNAPSFENVATEPIVAIIAGFTLLAALLSTAYSPTHIRSQDAQKIIASAAQQHTTISSIIDQKLQKSVDIKPSIQDKLLRDKNTNNYNTTGINNVHHVGHNLFDQHPLAIELAGIILLISLVGAIVIARHHVEPEETAPNNG